MKMKLNPQLKRRQRQVRVRARVTGTAAKPRLNVHRSLTGMYAQLIDDVQGKTLVSVHSKSIPAKSAAPERAGKVAVAYVLGQMLADKAKSLNISIVVFDRAGYKYHGRVQAVADGARDGGLVF